MGLTDRVPGMIPGRPLWNVSLGLAYVIFLATVVPVLARTYRPLRGC